MLNKLTKIRLNDENKQFIIAENQVLDRTYITIPNVKISLMIKYIKTNDTMNDYTSLQYKLVTKACEITQQNVAKVYDILGPQKGINKYIIQKLGIDLDTLYNGIKENNCYMKFEDHNSVNLVDITSITRMITPIKLNLITTEQNVMQRSYQILSDKQKSYDIKCSAIMFEANKKVILWHDIEDYDAQANSQLEIFDNAL